MPRPPSARNLDPARVHQGHHRPAAEPLLRHRHSRLHRRARQGGRRRPQGHLHDRCLEGLHKGRPQEPPARAGHPQDRRYLHPTGRRAALLAPRAGRLRSPTRRTTTTSTCRATSTAPSRRTSRTLTATCAAASRSAISTRWTGYWQVMPGVRAALFESAGRPGYARLKLPHRGGEARHPRPSRVHRFQSDGRPSCSPAGAKAATTQLDGLRQGRPPQGAHRDDRRGSARHLHEPRRCSTPTTSIST